MVMNSLTLAVYASATDRQTDISIVVCCKTSDE